MRLAAPNNHRILYDDNDVRVLLVSVRPGEVEKVHRHRWPRILMVLGERHSPPGSCFIRLKLSRGRWCRAGRPPRTPPTISTPTNPFAPSASYCHLI
jgi:hypothetical protein